MSDKILSGLAYLELPSSPETWLVDPLLPSGGIMLLYGDPKVGKSYAALQLADAIAGGKDFLGFKTRAGKVVYIQLDTPRNVWQTRIRELIVKGAITHPPMMADRQSIDKWPFDILNPEHLIILRDELQALKPDLVIIDTLRESHSADENDSTEMQKAIAAIVAATQPAAVCLLSHSRKPSKEEGLNVLHDNRGSSYVVGRMDAIVRLLKKSARVSGRSIEEHSIDLEREDSGFWSLRVSELDMHMTSVLLDPAHESVRAAAAALAVRINKSEDACRGMLRRFLKAKPDLRTHLR